jgi:hypothetical protein
MEIQTAIGIVKFTATCGVVSTCIYLIGLMNTGKYTFHIFCGNVALIIWSFLAISLITG